MPVSTSLSAGVAQHISDTWHAAILSDRWTTSGNRSAREKGNAHHAGVTLFFGAGRISDHRGEQARCRIPPIVHNALSDCERLPATAMLAAGMIEHFRLKEDE
jgi:hypothetical protein